MSRNVLIKIRRGTETQLSSIVLADGELGITTDTKRLYIGIGGVNVLLVNTSEASGDMIKSIYDTNNNGKADYADNVDWSGILNKPIAFPAAAHNHDDLYVAKGALTWNDLKGV